MTIYTDPKTRPLTEVEILRAQILRLEKELKEKDEMIKRIIGILYGDNPGLVVEFVQKKRRPHVDP